MRLLREARLLLDPARDPVERWLRVEWRDLSCRIHSCQELPRTARMQVEETLKLFRINEDPRLVRERIKILRLVTKDIDEGRLDYARARAIRFRCHSLVARQVLTDLGPSLPSPREELEWLLTDLMDEWKSSRQVLESGPIETAQKQRRELLWSFATLWHDPPEGMRTEVRSFLVQEGIFDYVKEYADRLTAINPVGNSE